MAATTLETFASVHETLATVSFLEAISTVADGPDRGIGVGRVDSCWLGCADGKRVRAGTREDRKASTDDGAIRHDSKTKASKAMAPDCTRRFILSKRQTELELTIEMTNDCARPVVC